MSTTEQLRREIQEYVMPRAATGSPVLWYRTGRKNCEPMVAYMLHCGGRTVQLFLTSGRRQDAVRHIDDPKLSLSVDQRESGAWDFTQETKDYAEFRKSLEDRLERIEKQIQDLSAGKSAKKKPGADNSDALRQYRELQREAARLGLKKNLKKDELQKAVADAKAKAERNWDPSQAAYPQRAD